MSVEDAMRWNERYKSGKNKSWRASPRVWLLDHMIHLPKHGMAIDLAMGLGESAGYLLHHQWDVVGVDISAIAVRKAKEKYPGILAVIADLNNVSFAERKFDLIMNFYFLQRSLIPYFRKLLKPGGFVVMETLTRSMKSVKPDIPLDYLLEDGELKTLFLDWEVFDYREGWYANSNGGEKSIASIFARLPE